MIQQIKNLSDNVIGFEFSDHVTAEEYEKVIFPAIKDQSKHSSRLNIICHFIGNTKIDLGAMWDDSMVGLKHFFNWGRIAVVSDIGWLNHTYKVMGFLLPGHLRTYSNADLQKAMDWVKEK